MVQKAQDGYNVLTIIIFRLELLEMPAVNDNNLMINAVSFRFENSAEDIYSLSITC